MNLSKEKSANTEQELTLESLPELSLPSSEQLSLLTAVLYRNELGKDNDSDRQDAIQEECFRRATGVHLSAQIFLHQNKSKSQSDLLFMASVSLGLKRDIKTFLDKSMLVLDPSANSDPVRDYLKEHGFRFKNTRGVWDNLKDLYVERAKGQNQTVEMGVLYFEAIKKQNEFKDEDGKVKYRVSKLDLEPLVRWRKQRRAERNKKGHLARAKKAEKLFQKKAVKKKIS